MKRDILFQQDKQFTNLKKPVKYLTMGYSLGKAAMSDTIIHGSFNYCSGGEGNIYTYYKLKYILEKTKIRVDYIILPCGFLAFNQPEFRFTNKRYYWIKYVDYLEIGSIKGEFLQYLFMTLKTKLFPYNFVLSYRLNALFAPDTGLPFEARQENDKYSEAMAHLMKTVPGKKELNSTVSLEYLRKTIQLCDMHKKRIIFINYPISYWYDKACRQWFGEATYDIHAGDSIIKATPANILWDFHNLYFEKDDYFRDSRHMNYKGKTAFSLFIKAKLDSLEMPGGSGRGFIRPDQ